MTLEELGSRYQRLRTELAEAYGAPVWDSPRIDSLTDAIADIESAIVASGAPEAFTLPRCRFGGNGGASAAPI